MIDSIVRQSKHQLGAEKDVFGPRFARNFLKTFQHIFECTEEERVSAGIFCRDKGLPLSPLPKNVVCILKLPGTAQDCQSAESLAEEWCV